MKFYYSGSLDEGRGGFLNTDIHGNDLPDDAVYVEPERHAELMDSQSAGAQIAGDLDTGAPVEQWPVPLSLAELKTLMVKQVKAEAERRILAISPIFQQMNDLRGIIDGDPVSEEVVVKFNSIDIIRIKSDQIELDILSLTTASALNAIDITAHPLWPEIGPNAS